MEDIYDHHDGHGLNEKLLILRGEDRYHYVVGDAGIERDEPFADITFQSQNPTDGVNGITDEALVAILLDRARAWQAGPLRSRENAIIITKLEEVLHWKRHRADDRARRGVLGSREK